MASNLDTRRETTLRDFLDVIFRRKWVIVGVVVFATAMVFYLNARRPELFESTSRILVKRGEQSATGAIRYLGWAEEVSSQIEVILSDEVFSKARKVFADSVAARGLPATIRFNPGFVRADVVGESNVFVIKYTEFNPVLCKLGCQAMTTAFEDYYRERKSPPELTDFFVQEIADVRSDIDYWQKKRNDFLNEKRFFGMDEESRFYLAKISNLERELLDLEGKISAQQVEVDNLSDLVTREPEDLENEIAVAMSGQLFQSGIVRQIKYSLQNLNIRREELLHKYTPKHPQVIAIEKQISDLRDDLKDEIENSYQVADQALKTMYAKKAKVTDEIDEANAHLSGLPDKDMEFSRIETTLQNLQEKYQMLLKRQSESQIELASRPEWEITVLSQASNAYSKKTRDYVRISLGPVLSLIVALGLAFFLESMDHSVKNSAEAEEYLNASVLATISEIRK